MQTMMVKSLISVAGRPAAGCRSLCPVLCSVLCSMLWLAKQILLLIVAIQLAAPAGWCCRLNGEASATAGRTVRRCCALHDSPHSPQRPASTQSCCCPKAATVAKSVEAPAGDDSAAELAALPDLDVTSGPRLAKSVLSRRTSGWIEHRSCARHVELCVWLC